MSITDEGRKGGGGLSHARHLLHDGRSLVLATVALYLSVVAGVRALWKVDIWPWLGVPSGPSVFFDARNVAAAVDCSRLGHDPLVDNPCDPWDRVMFYPRVWLVLRATGLEQRHTLLFGAVVVVLFLLVFMLLLPRLSTVEGMVVAAAVCSPAVMFAVERANMDLVIFTGLTVATLVWRRGSAAWEYVAVAIVLVMAVAKLYPAVALLAFLMARRRGTRTAAAVALVLFAAYVAATRDDVATISSTTTQGQYYSYGARILLGELYHAVVGAQWGGSRALAQGLVLVAVILVALALWLGLRDRLRKAAAGAAPPETAEVVAFRMAALIYVGTFLIGNSFDYRLVFLLLALPLLLRWAAPRPAVSSRWTLPHATLGVVIVALWIGTVSEQLRLADELVSWTLAGLLLVLLVRTVPPIGARPTSVDGGR